MTSAVHFKNGEDCHAVVLQALHVMVEQDGDTWFAQGIEIDYAAAGTSLEDVRARFERGLRRTIEENLKRHSSIERILKWAPEEVVQAFGSCERKYELDHLSIRKGAVPAVGEIRHLRFHFKFRCYSPPVDLRRRRLEVCDGPLIHRCSAGHAGVVQEPTG